MVADADALRGELVAEKKLARAWLHSKRVAFTASKHSTGASVAVLDSGCVLSPITDVTDLLNEFCVFFLEVDSKGAETEIHWSRVAYCT
jgi:hypothetical protein